MTKTVTATIEPELLKWARETAGFSLDDAAKKIQIKPERLDACERGDAYLTFRQLGEIANAYKRPVALFYLAAPPRQEPGIHDFRLDPRVANKPLSPLSNIEIRRARQRRDEALELAKEIDQDIPAFAPHAAMREDPEAVATRINAALGASHTVRKAWKSANVAYNNRKSAVEALDVLVFEASRIPILEMRGVSLPFEHLPVIVVNGADSPNGRSFTLLHELTHLFLRQGGICDMAMSESNTPDARIEAFCNAVSAASLMPADETLALLPKGNVQDWTMEELRQMAKPFHVSREAMLRRLVTLGRATRRHYFAMRPKFIEEYRTYREDQKSDSEGGPSPAVMAVRNLGRPFVQLVLGAYAEDRIGLATVSDYLGVKLKHLPRIRDLIRGSEVAA